ncbi:MAG: hypothetical protein KGH72_00205 [Candidatus Micrarchaeota archaeon]|nr:hypothetical protein [Candidatus Micrarchaeota archaeon]
MRLRFRNDQAPTEQGPPAMTFIKEHGKRIGKKLASPLIEDILAHTVQGSLDYFAEISGRRVLMPGISTFYAPGYYGGYYDYDNTTLCINLHAPMHMLQAIALHENGHHVNFNSVPGMFYEWYQGRSGTTPVEEGTAELFAAIFISRKLGDDDMVANVVRLFDKWYRSMSYTYGHYIDLRNGLARHLGLDITPIHDEKVKYDSSDYLTGTPASLHNVGTRLMAMYLIGSGMQPERLLVDAITTPESVVHERIMQMVEGDREAAIAGRIASYKELTRS